MTQALLKSASDFREGGGGCYTAEARQSRVCL